MDGITYRSQTMRMSRVPTAGLGALFIPAMADSDERSGDARILLERNCTPSACVVEHCTGEDVFWRNTAPRGWNYRPVSTIDISE